MTNDTNISLAPWIQILGPIIQDLVELLIGLAVAWAVARYHAWTGKEIAQADQDALKAKVEEQAGLILAKSESALAGQSIDAHDPRIAKAANWMAANLPGILKSAGVSTDDVAHRIAAAIGHAQAQQIATVPLAQREVIR